MNPENPYAIAYSALVLSLFAAGLTLLLALFFTRVIRGRPLLPLVPRRPVPWTFVDLLPIALFLLLSLSGVITAGLQSSGLWNDWEPPAVKELSLANVQQLILIDTLFKLVLTAVVIVWIQVRHRPTALDWGCSGSRWRDDLIAGCGTFLVIFFPTLMLQGALVYLLEWKYEHPVIELTTRTKDPQFFALSVLAAVIIAPLFEEFVFRGLLQGWLEKVLTRRATAADKPTADSMHHATNVAETEHLPADQTGGEIKWIDPNPYASPTPLDEPVVRLAQDAPLPPGRANWAAIAISTILFSLAHFSHGPAWIPLLLFGAALGYVYQRTHSLWPSIIAHMLLNGTTMIGLWVQVYAGD